MNHQSHLHAPCCQQLLHSWCNLDSCQQLLHHMFKLLKLQNFCEGQPVSYLPGLHHSIQVTERSSILVIKGCILRSLHKSKFVDVHADAFVAASWPLPQDYYKAVMAEMFDGTGMGRRPPGPQQGMMMQHGGYGMQHGGYGMQGMQVRGKFSCTKTGCG